MAIDAIIEAVRHGTEHDTLWLKPRIDGSGRKTITGRRMLHITKTPERVPRVGDEIWGNAHGVVIGGHRFRRIMQLWDGTFQVL